MKRRKFLEMESCGSTAAAISLYFRRFSQDRKIKTGLIGTVRGTWYGLWSME